MLTAKTKSESEKPLDLVASFEVEPEIQAKEGEAAKPRRFNMEVYNGGAMRLSGWYNPVVIDMSGLDVSKQEKPIYYNHNSYSIENLIGQTESIKKSGNKLSASGIITGTSDVVNQIISHSKAGFKWQASIGARAEKVEYIPEGKSVSCNGQTFNGPINVALKSSIGEISFVALGADENTSAQIAASNNYFDKESTMSEEVKKDGQAETIVAKSEPAKTVVAEVKASAPAETPDPVKEIRAAAAAEMKRIADIGKVAGSNTEICAKAVAEGWTPEKAELEVLRASRPAGNIGIHVSTKETTPDILEAAAVMSGGISADETAKSYGAKTVEAAQKQFRHGIGLQRLLLEAAWANGYNGRSFMDDPTMALRAAFSTVSIATALSNVANKYLLNGWTAVEQSWRSIAAIRPVKDFKQITSFRLTSDMEYDEVGPDGELKHAQLADEHLHNQAKTYGKILSITRKDIINDDLGCLTAVPKMLGRGAGLKFNNVFWTTFLANTSIFPTNNSNLNYYANAAANLCFEALQVVEQMFLDQKDTNSKPLGLAPKILLVPTALKRTAMSLMMSDYLNELTASTKKQPARNTFQNSFEVVTSTYLGNSSYSGYSATAWYLLADPAELAVIEACFLNGREEPIIEQAQADFDNLGVSFRGYHDFGVALQEYRAGVMSKGTS